MLETTAFKGAQPLTDITISNPLTGFEKLGFELNQIRKIKDALDISAGVIIVAGFIMDGKTTTIAHMMQMFDEIGSRPVTELQYSIDIKNLIHIQLELNAFQKYVVSDDFDEAREFMLRLPPKSVIVVGNLLGDKMDLSFHFMLVENGHLVITELSACSIEQLKQKLLETNPRECLKKNVSAIIMQNLRTFETTPTLKATIYGAGEITF